MIIPKFSNTTSVGKNWKFNQVRGRFTLPPSSFFLNYALLFSLVAVMEPHQLCLLAVMEAYQLWLCALMEPCQLWLCALTEPYQLWLCALTEPCQLWLCALMEAYQLWLCALMEPYQLCLCAVMEPYPQAVTCSWLCCLLLAAVDPSHTCTLFVYMSLTDSPSYSICWLS